MQLIYRSNTYDYDRSMFADRPFQMVRNPGLAHDLIYRGVTCRVDPSEKLNKIAKSIVSHKLIYRGLVYFTNGTAQVEATPELEIAA